MLDINQIDTTFPADMPQDPRLMELLEKAYKGEVMCVMAVAKIETIKPFSDYQVPISPEYAESFKRSLVQKGVPEALYVYAQDGQLIMSDDYAAYTMYKQLGITMVRCVVIGDTPTIEGVTYAGEPFRLPLPTVERS